VGLQAGQVTSAVQASQAAVQTAQTQVATAEANASSAASAIETAKANLASARVAEQTARRDYARYQTLYRQGFVTAQQLDQSKAAWQTAQTRLQAGQSSLASAQRQKEAADAPVTVARRQVEQARSQVGVAAANQPEVGVREREAAAARAEQAQARAGVAAARTQYDLVSVRKADVATAQANVEAARAQLANARRQMEETTIVAPSDGVVSQVTAQPGQVVQPNEPLMALVASGERWVDANFKETQLARMEPGMAATIRVDVLGKTYAGHVESVAPATGAQFALLPPENASGNFTKVVQRVPVRVVFDQPTTLQLGLSCEVTVDTTAAPEVVSKRSDASGAKPSSMSGSSSSAARSPSPSASKPVGLPSAGGSPAARSPAPRPAGMRSPSGR
jgi:membrane fusion protein (multidrug efflux system)